MVSKREQRSLSLHSGKSDRELGLTGGEAVSGMEQTVHIWATIYK